MVSGVIFLGLKEVGAFVINHLPDYRGFRTGGAISPFLVCIYIYIYIYICVCVCVCLRFCCFHVKAKDKVIFPGDSMKIYIDIS